MFLNLSGKTFCLSQSEPILQQIESLLSDYHTTLDNFSFFSNGKMLKSFEDLPVFATIVAVVPLRGGKGGYGAKLKTEGGKKVRPNDNMFSRDTSGRRISHVSMEKQMYEHAKKKFEEEKLVAQERQLCKILESTIKESQLFNKLDLAYKKQVEDKERSLVESILIGKKKIREKNMKNQKASENQEEKMPIKEEVHEEEQVKTEKVEEGCVKRSLPMDFKQEVQEDLKKKQKIEVKPMMSLAQQKFKLMFSKA